VGEQKVKIKGKERLSALNPSEMRLDFAQARFGHVELVFGKIRYLVSGGPA
jgi:hypothetical protein